MCVCVRDFSLELMENCVTLRRQSLDEKLNALCLLSFAFLSLAPFNEEFNFNILMFARRKREAKGCTGVGKRDIRKKLLNLIKNSYLSHQHNGAERC